MRREDLTPIYVSVDLSYPPLPRFKESELPAFYAEVHRTHQFESFEMHGDSGGVLETEGERRLRVTRGELEYEEYVRDVRDAFPLVRQRTVELLEDAAKHFSLRLFILTDTTIRALWPTSDDTEVSKTLRERAFSINDDQFNLLGDVDGAAMSLTGMREEPDFHWTLEIAPYLRDESKLFIELSAHPHEPYETPRVVGEFMQSTFDFLDDNVVHFVNTFMD